MRWIFWDVRSGGAAAIVGIESAKILLGVDGLEIMPSEHSVFSMGKQTRVSMELPQKFKSLGLVVEGGTAHESTARIRAIFGVSLAVRCSLRSTGNAAM